MAKVTFKRIPSNHDSMKYQAEFSRDNKGLPVFERQRSAKEMTTITVTHGQVRNYPHGTDSRGDDSRGRRNHG